ncbi:hypothetical protein [Pseudoxanthobacter sp.]|uniref:hypothetical protein n=1 Tax=Pseudoxanthobacter sp. TaxID=1925742 RepID=UPI002FE237FD
MGKTSVRAAVVAAALGAGLVAAVPACEAGTDAPVAGKTESGLYAAPPVRIGRWELTRYTRDVQGSQLSHCAAMVLTASETGLFLAYSAPGNSFRYGFSGAGSAAAAGPIPVRIRFDGRTAAAREAVLPLMPDDNGFDWRTASVAASAGPGLAEELTSARKITFSYTVDGKAHDESFALAGIGPVLKALFACGR